MLVKSERFRIKTLLKNLSIDTSEWKYTQRERWRARKDNFKRTSAYSFVCTLSGGKHLWKQLGLRPNWTRRYFVTWERLAITSEAVSRGDSLQRRYCRWHLPSPTACLYTGVCGTVNQVSAALSGVLPGPLLSMNKGGILPFPVNKGLGRLEPSTESSSPTWFRWRWEGGGANR